MKTAAKKLCKKVFFMLMMSTFIHLPNVSGGIRGVVDLDQAGRDLQSVVNRNPDLRIFAATGRSMAPFFDEYSLLLVRPVEIDTLKPGMIVVFRDNEGDLVGHRLVRDGYGNLRTRGHANSRLDEEPLSAERLVGAVVATFKTNAITAASGRYPVAVGKSR